MLRLLKRPHPQWTLRRVSELLYGDDRTVMKYATRGCVREEFCGTESELTQLAELEELGVCEYREEAVKMLGRPAIGLYRSQTWHSQVSWQPLLFLCVALYVAWLKKLNHPALKGIPLIGT